MNIVVGKLGKKIYFDFDKIKSNSGDIEVTTQIITLAAYYPSFNFYVIGINDLDKLSQEKYTKLFPNANVRNAWQYFNNKMHDRITFIDEYFTKMNISIDFGYLHAGPAAQVNIPEKTYLIKDKENEVIAKTIQMAKTYAGPLVYFLNESKIPFVIVGEDPRNLPFQGRDLHNRPAYYGSSLQLELSTKHDRSYFDKEPCVEITEKVMNIKFDRLFLVAENMENISKNLNADRSGGLNIFTHGSGSSGLSKMKIMNKYLNKSSYDDMKIYGQWSDKVLEKSDISLDKFIGIDMSDMPEILYDTKYTLMFNLKDKWPSSKFWKMIYYGIIPFFYAKFDDDHNMPVHDFLRIETPQELAKKVKALDKSPEARLKLIQYHNSKFKQSYFDGSLIAYEFKEIINDILNKNIIASRDNVSEVLIALKENSTLW